MLDKIREKARQLEDSLIKTRRYLHQNPELSCHEHNTAKYIHSKFIEAGIEAEIIETEAGPAVIGNIITGDDRETIAFRADMDALPLCDGKEKEYCSKNKGVMHACGHDFNMASTLGTALVLAALKEELKVNVKFIFQPSEEKSEGGSFALIKQNIMKDVSAIWSVHANPSIEAGKIGIGYGTMTASVDFFRIFVKGKGGHSARPHEATDAIFIANNIINYLYSGVSKNFDPVDPMVISVGEINGGSAPNIIAETCEIKGTIRAFNQNIRKNLQDLISKKALEIANSNGAEAELTWEFGPPSVVNNEILTKLTQETAIEVLGQENIIKLTRPSMGAEDFSRYLDYAPGMLIRIGTGGEDCSYPLHNCLFDIDEKSIITAVKLLSSVCINYQNKKPVFPSEVDSFII